jgi:gamma-glutamylcyclotransferase (GGCT)/AIG2-like uncharacterized protein YtfP
MSDWLKSHPHCLAVYGTLKRVWGNHDVLTRHGARFISEGRTMEKFVLTEQFPYVWQPGTALQKVYEPYLGQVVVELYRVSDAGLEACDRLEGHPTHYRRTPVTVLFGPEPQPQHITAGLYLRPRSIDPEELMEPKKGLLEWGTVRQLTLEPLHPQFRRKRG